MPTKGYHSYRGKTSFWKKLLIVLLVLILLGSLTFLFLQRFVVYDSDGSIRIEILHGKKEEPPEKPSALEDDFEIVIEEPKEPEKPRRPAQETLHALTLSTQVLRGGTDAALADLGAQEANAFAIRVKEDSTGRLLYTSAIPEAAKAGAVAGNSVADGVLADLLDAPYYAIAQISALHDSAFAAAYPAEAGILQLQYPGVVWYAPDSTFYLAPEKELTRSYLCAVAAECAALGFDELLFDSFAYPDSGRISNIDTGGRSMKPDKALALLAKELRKAVDDTEVKLSVVLEEETVLSGGNEQRGQNVSELSRYFDRIYVRTAEEKLPALREAAPECEIVPILPAAGAEGSFLLAE